MGQTQIRFYISYSSLAIVTGIPHLTGLSTHRCKKILFARDLMRGYDDLRDLVEPRAIAALR